MNTHPVPAYPDKTKNRILPLPCLDSATMAERCRADLDIPRDRAAELGRSATSAAEQGSYINASGVTVDWSSDVRRAVESSMSIAPLAPLPPHGPSVHEVTEIQVSNETTMVACRRLAELGMHPLALNFANGAIPGGGFLNGARAQEECLCRSSALYSTLVGDRMYAYHRSRPLPDSSSWSILSPWVPFFRNDDGTVLDAVWHLDILTCAAPYAPTVGREPAAEMLKHRINRVLEIARAWGHDTLVLGAWGCGAFGNDPARTANDFRSTLENEFRGAFSHVLFAITDWSPERRFLGPFRDTFAEIQIT